MNGHDDPRDDVALYALGVLPSAEAALVRARIEGDPALRREYATLRSAADAVALIAEEPVDSARSARMRERLLAHVRSEATPIAAARRSKPIASSWLWASSLAAAVALVFTALTVAQDVNLRGSLAQEQRRSADLRAQLGASQRLAARDRQTLADLLAPDARRFAIADGAVVVHEGRIVFALHSLPAPPRGHVYQAWYAPPGATTMQPSITFAPNAEGVAVVRLPVDGRRVGVVAVSVEPDGGSRAPTTAPTFIRPLS